MLRDTWETIGNKLSLPLECKTILLQTQDPVKRTHTHTRDVEMLLQFLTRAARYVKGPLLKKLFTFVARRVALKWCVKVPRRLTLKVPSYGQLLARWATHTLQSLFTKKTVPPALKLWLKHTICVVPRVQEDTTSTAETQGPSDLPPS